MPEHANPPSAYSWFRDRWLVVAGVGALLAFAAALLTATVFAPRRDTWTPAPQFLLRDEQGRLTSLAQFRGQVVLLTFVDPYCTQICPLTTQSMLQAVQMLGPSAAGRVQLLGIDANPLKTKVSDVAYYTRSHEMQGRWRFLTGSLAQLKSVWQAYHVYVAAIGNNIDHQAIVFLIDRNGRERQIYSTPMSYGAVGVQAQTMAQGIAQLLPGIPAAFRDASLEQPLAPLAPADRVSLPALGPHAKPVGLGAGNARLFLFFAGWLEESADLSSNLSSLDAYAALARRHGWPAPVAVDEITTEPSTIAARQILSPIAAKLETPIIEDGDGRLADGYQVDDLPWYVLSSRSGKILWRHDGWLSAAALSQSVRAALAAR